MGLSVILSKGIGIMVIVRISVVGAAVAGAHSSDRIMKSSNALIARTNCIGTLYPPQRERAKPLLEVHHRKLDLIGMWNVTLV